MLTNQNLSGMWHRNQENSVSNTHPLIRIQISGVRWLLMSLPADIRSFTGFERCWQCEWLQHGHHKVAMLLPLPTLLPSSLTHIVDNVVALDLQIGRWQLKMTKWQWSEMIGPQWIWVNQLTNQELIASQSGPWSVMTLFLMCWSLHASFFKFNLKLQAQWEYQRTILNERWTILNRSKWEWYKMNQSPENWIIWIRFDPKMFESD